MQIRTGLLTAAAFALAACGTTNTVGGQTVSSAENAPGWRKVTQVEQRTAAYVSQPATRQGDQVTFKLAFVYAPGQIMWENKPVAWQIYEAVTIVCAKNEVRLGKRTRYDETGAEMMSDEDPNFASVSYGTVAADAAIAQCKDRVWVDAFSTPDGSGWQARARANLAAVKPPQKPNGFYD